MKRMQTMMGSPAGWRDGDGRAGAAALAADKSKRVIQVSENDPATWDLALNNAKNIQRDVGKDNVELEVVVFGPGINMLKAEPEMANRVNEAVDSGLQVMACQNTMRNK